MPPNFTNPNTFYGVGINVGAAPDVTTPPVTEADTIYGATLSGQRRRTAINAMATPRIEITTWSALPLPSWEVGSFNPQWMRVSTPRRRK